MVEGLGVQPVPGEDRDVLAELDVARRLSPAQVVVVHRGQVVVDERIRMDQLDRAGERQHLSLLQAQCACGREREHRAYALAAGQKRVAHRLLKAGGQGLAREAHRVQVRFDLLAQMLGVGGAHSGLLEQAVLAGRRSGPPRRA